MQIMQTIATSPISANTPTSQIGLCATRGGLITVDTSLEEYFKGLHIGTAGATGTLLIKGIDNEVIPIKGLLNGSWVFILGYAVVSAATVDGESLTTTCSDISWIGGA